MTTAMQAAIEDGHIDSSASHGEFWLVRITYNTDPSGAWVADDNYDNYTLHGPFETSDEAVAWMDAYPDGDKDLKDMDVIVGNKVCS